MHDLASQILTEQPTLLIGLAGGSTPMAAYAKFATMPLPWSRIALTLIDERFVPVSDTQSNEKNIAAAFSAVKPQLAGWHGLMHDLMPIQQVTALSNQEIQDMHRSLDIAVIGMGGDGHIASLFVESADYEQAIDVECDAAVVPIRFSASESKMDRISFSLAELLKAKKILICIAGDEKRRVLENSLDGSRSDYAVAQLLKHYSLPIDIFWSPA